MKEAVAGIDVGGSSTKFGLVTRSGEVLFESSVETNSNIPFQEYFKQLYRKIVDLQQSCQIPVELKGIGIGAPNGNSLTGMIDSASNLNWGKTIPVAELLSSWSNLPTVLSNDANASAIGEMLFGVAAGMRNFITITLGTGLGSGIVVNGELIGGHHGHAGELGHLTVFYDGRSCGCGRKGCLETYASATGIVRTVQEMLKADVNRESLLRNIPPDKLDARTITDAAKQGDILAKEAFRFTGEILGRKLADVVAMVNPEAIILSGGLAMAGGLILEPTRSYMEDQLLDVYKGKVKIISSGMSRKNAAILGAAAFIWKEIDAGVGETERQGDS